MHLFDPVSDGFSRKIHSVVQLVSIFYVRIKDAGLSLVVDHVCLLPPAPLYTKIWQQWIGSEQPRARKSSEGGLDSF